MESSAPAYRDRIEQLFADARRQREEWMQQLPAALRALLPLDATPITQGMALLADAVGIGERVASAQREQSHANAAVLHGRVFGREAPLTQDTALAAFADGARVRDGLLLQLAETVDGAGLRRDVQELLPGVPDLSPELPADERTAALATVFAAQEQALLLCAQRLDDVLRD
ncbi:hypothetical protein [Conexibacter sp. CPCC 206217]|uniref:hypothetical protein n=1 Tax=Conexibacter sp. CPCC 206217 TaxID=3064574 RepID=UPI00271601AD|nr:hypothetical protein [Conexibacter sp. CPCC 206217]MDO8211609.1 hypothetical protein [Conexibacter sp. CPCC 206217]